METGDPEFEGVLDEFQLRFCEGYLLYGNVEQAWEHAYELPLTVEGRKEAFRWYKNPLIRHTIIEMESAEQRLAHVNEEEHLIMLGKIRNAALLKGKFSIALTAEKARGAVAGLYSKKLGPRLDTKNIRELSTDEIRRRLESNAERGVTVIEGTSSSSEGGGEPE